MKFIFFLLSEKARIYYRVQIMASIFKVNKIEDLSVKNNCIYHPVHILHTLTTKSFLIYGCAEQEDGDFSYERDIARDMYSKVGFTPLHIVDSYSIGNRTQGRTRPIKLEVEHLTVLRKSAQKLKASNMSLVYIIIFSSRKNKGKAYCPQKLVTEMKSMLERDLSK